MFCPNCKNEVNEDWSFCNICGKPLNNTNLKNSNKIIFNRISIISSCIIIILPVILYFIEIDILEYIQHCYDITDFLEILLNILLRTIPGLIFLLITTIFSKFNTKNSYISLYILSFLFPILGFLAYIIHIDSNNDMARTCARTAWLGIFTHLIIALIIFWRFINIIMHILQ